MMLVSLTHHPAGHDCAVKLPTVVTRLLALGAGALLPFAAPLLVLCCSRLVHIHPLVLQ